METSVRSIRISLAMALCVAVIIAVGVFILALAPVSILLLPVLVVTDLPNPMIAIAWLWSWMITQIMRRLINIQVVIEGADELNLYKRHPVICVCNHPPAALFPMLVWATTTYVRLWPAAISKVSNLWNPILAPFVVIPSILLKALVITTRGNGWGAHLVEFFTRMMVSRYSMLLIFADQHRPGSAKARADYERMRVAVPSIQWHARLGAYHYRGIYAAFQALGPTTQVVAVDMSFPRGAVGWHAPRHLFGRTVAIRMRDVTDRVRRAMQQELSDDGRPDHFLSEVNILADEADDWIVTHNR